MNVVATTGLLETVMKSHPPQDLLRGFGRAHSHPPAAARTAVGAGCQEAIGPPPSSPMCSGEAFIRADAVLIGKVRQHTIHVVDKEIAVAVVEDGIDRKNFQPTRASKPGQ